MVTSASPGKVGTAVMKKSFLGTVNFAANVNVSDSSGAKEAFKLPLKVRGYVKVSLKTVVPVCAFKMYRAGTEVNVLVPVFLKTTVTLSWLPIGLRKAS